MPKVYNQKNNDFPRDAIYVGRPSYWGNPFVIGKDGTREEVLEIFEAWFKTSNKMQHIIELKGKDLVCHCSPLPCHADLLLKWANDASVC
jgi:hypothetical protein